jgi:phospholipid/cholesterol/gamma-HCH transport system substrate-binding protein
MYELQKKIAWASLKSGIVISLALIILFCAIFFSSNISALFSPKSLINVRITNIQGLSTGAPVWLFGAEIGNVKYINITNNGVAVTISIERKYIHLIHKDAVASVMTMGILGDKFIELNQGNVNTETIHPQDTISGISSVGFEQVTSAAVSVMTEMDSVVFQLSALLHSITSSTGSFSQLLNDSTLYKQLSSSAKALSSITNNIASAQGTMKMMVENPELYNNLNIASEQFASVMNRIDHGFGNGGTASALVNDSTMASNLRQTISTLKETATSINELIIDIKNNPKKYISIKIF